jgi:hypothetical protein
VIECCGLWVGLWVVVFLTYGLWKLTERLSRPKPPPPPPPPPPDEAALRARREEDDKRRAEEAEKATAKAEAQRYFDENADALRDVFPRAAFNTWLRLYMADDVGAKERWDALRELISRLQPLVAQGGKRRQQSDKRRGRREKRLREIDEEIAICEENLARGPAAELEADMAADEESRLRRQLRTLREERQRLDPNS